MDEGTSQEGPSASIKSRDKNQASNDDTAEGISLEGSSASGSSVDDTTPSVLNEKNVTEIENSELGLHELMDEGISPESPSASLWGSDKNSEAIENSVGEGGSLMLGFPTDFLKSDRGAGKNAPAFQEKTNEQNTEMREKTSNFLKKVMCQNCFTIDVFCKCAKDTTRSKNGFRNGVKPSGPASFRKKGNKS